MELKDIIDPNAVRYTASVSSKKRILQDIAEQAHAVYGLNAIEVFSALQEREALGSTGVGRGIAIPHARFDSMDRVVGMFTRLEKPVDFDSVDHQPVDLVFTLLAPAAEGAEHLKALALVSRTLRDKDVCSKLRANQQEQTLFTLLTEIKAPRAA
jgi:PTS system nitrogen regulatory IIA component